MWLFGIFEVINERIFMYHGRVLHIPILIYTLLYTVILAVASRVAMDDVIHVGIAVAILSILSAFAGRVIARHFFFAIVPVFLSVATLVLLFFIDSVLQQQIIVGIVGLLVYGVTLGSYRLSKQPRDAVARGMVVAAATAALFFSYAAVFAVYLNFIIPEWLVGFCVLVLTTVIAWQYFVMIAQGRFVQTIVYSVMLSTVLMEISLAAVAWPFGYLTTSVVLLMIYYILWDLAQSFFLDRLSKVRLVTNIAFFLVVAVMVLLSAQWVPVV